MRPNARENICQQWLDSLIRRGLFRHPERLTLEFDRKQRRLLHAFSRAMRAGPPPCPHCGRTITAEDLATVAQKSKERLGFGGKEIRGLPTDSDRLSGLPEGLQL
ncbi:MAG: hypothetical protein V3T83_21325 [Acidobacteriota bacterium]